MHLRYSFLFGTFFLLTLLLMNSARAAGTKQYTNIGKAVWGAFECASLATKINNPGEHKRLYRYGYGQGQRLITELTREVINSEEMSAVAPMAMMLLLDEANSDFVLEKFYEAAQDSVLDEVYRTGDRLNSSDEQSAIARTKFNVLNCKQIGA